MSDPIRGLSEEFLSALDTLADRREGPNWWRDVLLRDDLFVAVRKEYINIYHRGCSIWQVTRDRDALVPRTHAKYLVRNRQNYCALQDGHFAIEPANAIWTAYTGPETLEEMIAAAKTHAGLEKIGVHDLAVANPNVVDLELNLANSDADTDVQQEDEEQEGKKKKKRKFDRIDMAAVDSGPIDGSFAVIFWEAKHFSNGELRAAQSGKAEIYDQMERYETGIEKKRHAIASGYRQICKAQVRIHAMRERIREDAGAKATQRPLDERIRGLADSRRDPVLDLRLVIFGFDNDQKLGAAFEKHIKPLQDRFPGKVRVIGSAKNMLKPSR